MSLPLHCQVRYIDTRETLSYSLYKVEGMRKGVTDFLSPQYFMTLRKRDYERGIRLCGELIGRADHTEDELNAIGREIPVRVLQDGNLLASYAAKNGLSINDTATVVVWILSQADFLADMKVSSDIPYGDAVKCYEQVRTNAIILHRLNYILHECMTAVYNILERDGRLRFAVKKEYNAAEKIWDGHMSARRKVIEKTAFATMDDHLRLACNAVWPYQEKVYESIRDYMIMAGSPDIELRARCAVVFLMTKVAGHSRAHFFEQAEKDCGVNFSACFKHVDMTEMVGHFINMCSSLGIKTDTDGHGYPRLSDIDIEEKTRFRWAWKDYITILRDDDVMDNAAMAAISQNPAVQKEYEHVLAEAERKQEEENISRLSEKFNVKRL